ncbi:hypothetical protein ACIA8O_07120 [Kitasatospora sp. NPDC051853]|uniref:hypothetical protein n=1 Tax=Kitasatospora sp. NPDC051853 TaxID=3364058 RepID=UPI00379A51EA
MTVDQERVLRARMRLMSLDRRLLRGTEGLWVYRTLVRVSPEVYGSKLARVLVEVSGSERVAGLPEQRRALLAEAREWAGRIAPGHPYRAKVMERLLEAERREGIGG